MLILPFRRTATGAFEFAALRRSDDGRWQGVAGGGEDDESPAETARRELGEELDIDSSAPLFALRTVGQVPADVFEARSDWPDSLESLPEHTFAIDCTGQRLRLSDEHTAIEWDDADATAQRRSWPTNRFALEELCGLLADGGLDSLFVTP